MKIKQRIAILERAYDKAVKFVPGGNNNTLADMERTVLSDAIRWSRQLSEPARIANRNHIWKILGWNKPEAEAKWQQFREGVINGRT